jgi:DNA-binding transcriptional activator of the SARP family
MSGDLLLKQEYESANRDTLLRNLSINDAIIPNARRFGPASQSARQQPTTIGPEYDYLSMDGWTKSSSPQGITNVYNYLNRLKTLASKGPAILATARNEAVYLPDWCAYHFSIGFEKIFLYTNSNNDKTLEVASRLQELGLNIAVTQSIINNPKSSPQIKAYRYALSIDSEILDHNWCATIDLDEYLAIKINNKIRCVSDWLNSVCAKSLFNCDLIAIPWIFASLDNDFTDFDDCDKPITQRIKYVSAKNKSIKSIFKPQPFIIALPHHPLATMYYTPFAVMSNGEMYGEYQTSSIPSVSDFPSYDNGVIMHYHHKSTPEFIWKKSRTGGARMIADIIPDRSVLSSLDHAQLEKRHKAINWINRVRATEQYNEMTAMMRSDVTLGQYLAQSKAIMNEKYQSWLQQRS